MRHRVGFYEKYGKRFLDFFLRNGADHPVPRASRDGDFGAREAGSPVIFCQEASGQGRADLQAPQIPQHERRAG